MIYSKKTVRLLSLVAALALLCLCVGGCSGDQEDIATEYMDPGVKSGMGSYKTATVTTGDFEITYSADARMSYQNGRALYWPYAEDRCGQLQVKMGDFVSKGDVLATFEINVSEADLLEKEMAVSDAQSSLDSVNTSYSQQVSQAQSQMSGLTGYAYDQAYWELSSLKEEWNAAAEDAQEVLRKVEEEREKLQERKETDKLTAPFDGYIVEVDENFRTGDFVDTQTPVLGVADVSSAMVSFTSSSPYGNVPYGSEVTLIDQRDQKKYTGTVVSCREVTQSEKDVVVISPQESLPDGALSGAIKVEGTILKKSGVLLVDSAALRQEGQSYYVLVLTEQNTVNKTYVTVGAQNGTVTWITGGLTDGQTVVLE